MARESLFRFWKFGLIGAAVLLLVAGIASRPAEELGLVLFFAVLVLISSFLRIETNDVTVGFESAVAFGALLIFHTPMVALVAVAAGSSAHALWQLSAQRKWHLEPFYDTAQLVLSYAVVGSLYTLAVAPDALPAAKMAGFALLLVGYVGLRVLFVSLRRYFEDQPSSVDLRRVLLVESRMLLFITPVVAVETMLYDVWGVGGFAVAFLPMVIIAFAMRNEAEAAQQNVELVRRNRELAILTESSTQILSAESDHETLRRLTSLLTQLASMKACAVVTWEPSPDVSGTVYRYGECMRTDQEILSWVSSAGFAQSAPSRAFVFQSDMRKFPLSSGNAIQVLIGIQTPEVIYGILLFETEDPSILKTGSLNLLTLLVNQTALSIQDQLLRREMRSKTIELEKHAETMTTILEVSNTLIGHFDVDQALTRIAQAIRNALGFGSVVFALFDSRRGVYRRQAHAGLDDVWEEVRKRDISPEEIMVFLEPEFLVSNSYFVSHKALRKSEHDFFVSREEGSDPLRADEWHVNDLLLVPLMSGDELIGLLSVRDPADGRIPSLERVRTLEVFATQAVTAVQSARQYDEIRRLTFVDSLTPAWNHRYFQDALAKEISRHTRNGRELALAMLDIDDFKKINDSFGHPAGDEILKGLVEELMSNARESDIVARYGGEEFAIIFPETPAESARDAANRMRELIERRQFPLAQYDRTLFITVSIGVAVFPTDGRTSADLVFRADAALYWAKKHGKNQVAIASEVVTAQAM